MSPRLAAKYREEYLGSRHFFGHYRSGNGGEQAVPTVSLPSSKELVEVERVDHDIILRDKSIMVAGSVLDSDCLRNQHLQQHGNL